MSVLGFEALFAGLARVAGLEAEIKLEGQALAEQMAAAMRDELGTYQPGWPPLTAGTQAQRAAQGYTPDDPLLRSGAMQADITAWQGDDGDWRAGIPHDAASIDAGMANELGTLTVPPRPFVLPIVQDYGGKSIEGVMAAVHAAANPR